MILSPIETSIFFGPLFINSPDGSDPNNVGGS